MDRRPPPTPLTDTAATATFSACRPARLPIEGPLSAARGGAVEPAPGRDAATLHDGATTYALTLSENNADDFYPVFTGDFVMADTRDEGGHPAGPGGDFAADSTVALPEKPWWLSRTIVPLVTLALVNLLARLGVAGDDARQLVESGVGLAIELGLIVVAIYGRVKARTRIRPVGPFSTPAGSGGVFPAVLLGFVGCLAILAAAGGCAPSRAYLEAERATAAAIEPEYLGYVEADTALSPEQKQRRRNTVETAELRRRAATRAAIPGTP